MGELKASRMSIHTPLHIDLLSHCFQPASLWPYDQSPSIRSQLSCSTQHRQKFRVRWSSPSRLRLKIVIFSSVSLGYVFVEPSSSRQHSMTSCIVNHPSWYLSNTTTISANQYVSQPVEIYWFVPAHNISVSSWRFAWPSERKASQDLPADRVTNEADFRRVHQTTQRSREHHSTVQELW